MNTPLSSNDWEALSAYLDGQLSERDRNRLQQRMAADPELQRALEGLRQTKIILRSAPRRRAPRNFTLTKQMVPQRRRNWFQPVPAFSFGSVFAAILLIFALAFQYLPGLQGLRQAASPNNIAAQAPAAAPLPAATQAASATSGKNFGQEPSDSAPPLILWGPPPGMGGGGAPDSPGVASGMGGGSGQVVGTDVPAPEQTIPPEQAILPTDEPRAQAILGPTQTPAASNLSGAGPILGVQPNASQDTTTTQVESTIQAYATNQADQFGNRTAIPSSPGGINLGGLQIGLALLALGLGAAAFLFRRRS
jgi:hypothetical protein